MAVASVRIIPGLGGSGLEHWQTRWQQLRPECRRVEQARWDEPDLDDWCATLETAVRAAPAPVVLVAHSLGRVPRALQIEKGARRDFKRRF